MNMLILDPDMIPGFDEDIALQKYSYLDLQSVHFSIGIHRKLQTNVLFKQDSGTALAKNREL